MTAHNTSSAKILMPTKSRVLPSGSTTQAIVIPSQVQDDAERSSAMSFRCFTCFPFVSLLMTPRLQPRRLPALVA